MATFDCRQRRRRRTEDKTKQRRRKIEEEEKEEEHKIEIPGRSKEIDCHLMILVVD